MSIEADANSEIVGELMETEGPIGEGVQIIDPACYPDGVPEPIRQIVPEE